MEVIQRKKIDLALALFGRTDDLVVHGAARDIILAALDKNSRVEE